MEIKDRIIQIIEAEQLTSSKFADVVGVQRSSISHILSGRNNPSLEIIQKILTTFGTIDSDWLLFGRGSMYKIQHHSRKLDKESNLFSAIDSEKKLEDTDTEAKSTESKTEILENQKVENTTTEKTTSPPSQRVEQIQEAKGEKKESEKKYKETKTERIIIFNSDRTYTEYFPS
jgi:transcriptional regulator with XRE-family HTH domain